MFAKFYRSDCILEYLNFQNFQGEHAPGPPSFLCLRHSSLRRYYTYSQLCPTKEKFPAPPLLFRLVSPGEKRVLATPSWETISLVSVFFIQSWFSLLYFCRAKGAWGSQVHWPTVTMSKFFCKLKGVINIIITTTIKVKIMIFKNSCETWTQNFNHRDALFLLFKVHDTLHNTSPLQQCV